MGEHLRNFDGNICAMSPMGDRESSYCGGVFDGDVDARGDFGAKAKGPVTCPECARVIRELREDLRTIRIAKGVGHDH